MSDSQRILDSIRRLVRMLRVSDRQAQSELGVSGAQLFVLTELGKTPSLSLNDLAARTLTDQSSVSVVVTRLVDAGLITRDRDARDARRLVINLTRSGHALLQKAPPVAQERLLAVFDGLSDAERKRFADTLEEIVDNAGGDDGPAPMLFEEDATRRQHQLKAVPKKDFAAK
ncbi:MAG TPA: MarR family transcriptional regulator [Thermoanaerobaculia bacterium]|jgi:DNA-binding MarR family transcriptional regulator|nr:MarR family transcriptional regulator [Thermoanaerobaculia bacterium]